MATPSRLSYYEQSYLEGICILYGRKYGLLGVLAVDREGMEAGSATSQQQLSPTLCSIILYGGNTNHKNACSKWSGAGHYHLLIYCYYNYTVACCCNCMLSYCVLHTLYCKPRLHFLINHNKYTNHNCSSKFLLPEYVDA